MARDIRERLRALPSDVLSARRTFSHLGSTAALKKLRTKKVRPVTPVSKIRTIAKREAGRYKIRTVVSPNPNIFGKHVAIGCTRNNRHAVGYSVGTDKIYLHPILQYTEERYVRGVIGHEIDHIKVNRRNALAFTKAGYRIVRRFKNGDVRWEKPKKIGG